VNFALVFLLIIAETVGVHGATDKQMSRINLGHC